MSTVDGLLEAANEIFDNTPLKKHLDEGLITNPAELSKALKEYFPEYNEIQKHIATVFIEAIEKEKL